MADLAGAYATREVFVRRLEEDLLGDEGDAILENEEPTDRFVVGVLYPDREDRGRPGDEPEMSVESDQVDKSSDGDATAPTTDGADDPMVALARVRHPRTMGMTFAVGHGGAGVRLSLRADRYLPEAHDRGTRWVRDRIEDEKELNLSGPTDDTFEVADGLSLRVIVRPVMAGAAAVTVAVVNTAAADFEDRSAKCWFNPVVAVEGAADVLVARPPGRTTGIDDDEVASQDLLFDDVRSYAIGHGCSVTWDESEDGLRRIRTTFLPRHELLLSNPGGLSSTDLSMDAFGAGLGLDALEDLASDYGRWIDGIASEPRTDMPALDQHVASARQARSRIRAGIDLLKTDREVRRSFELMNRAMAQQRRRQDHQRSGGLGTPPDTPASWRPFQLAFILINLEGVARPESEDRRLADLLWFPTGGGKTEAYLGLIGITVLLRRVRDPLAGGVSVLMRYTLRLLTLQQYQRATGLICALEHVRQQELPGTREISIGLWVGRASTPNTLEEARRALNRARRTRATDDDNDGADPVQLRQCPWCGSILTHENYHVTDGSMVVACGYAGCEFRNGLPVHIVDEDVYRERPSLLIATADKFALMPWKREVGSLFGSAGASVDGEEGPPPDLIVQDELHLISGPLGTIVGLYETAVDDACSRPYPPKIVASTATIRRAEAQVRAVFGREARQFPPPGRSHRDSYFAVEAPREVKGSREYVGVMGAGTSHTTLMVRVYASLLQSGVAIDADDDGADLYWTLLGYFNSLRVLGGAFIQVIDDVPDQMKVIARRRGEEPRDLSHPREMTSRKKSAEIPRELEILATARGESDAADVVLATNMISVGVDVDRLGLMAVMGQPQTSSEYIQATSRVGRRDPGLVVTIFNAARSRDLSHYENFVGYHQALYRHVEATGATPFAPRARDRALHGVLVSMARLSDPAAAPESAAGAGEQLYETLRACAERIAARSELSLLSSEAPPEDQTGAQILEELERLIDLWLEDDRLQKYAGWFGRVDGALLREAGGALSDADGRPELPVGEPPWATLTSMRDVDAESHLFLIRSRRRRG